MIVRGVPTDHLSPPYTKDCVCAECLEADYNERIAEGVNKREDLIFVHPVWLMILCQKCGNKRCPHATNHIHECTDSNEYGQKGSSYGGMDCDEDNQP